MSPLRFLNPFYTRRLERKLAEVTARAEGLVALVEAEQKRRRGYLITVADALTTGRTSEAKTMVDALVLVLGGKDAA